MLLLEHNKNNVNDEFKSKYYCINDKNLYQWVTHKVVLLKFPYIILMVFSMLFLTSYDLYDLPISQISNTSQVATHIYILL